MSLEYSKAKNESLTCTYNKIFLHSSYNPQTESRRFAESIKLDFIPQNIIVIEPALSYCKKDLCELFPASKICAIRFIKDIKAEDKFEKEFIYQNISQLKTELFNYFGEEGLLNSFFITWPPAAKCFSEEDKQVWGLIKDLLKECQSILATRQFFSKRWIKNEFNFLSNISKCTKLKKINLPVFITASGPSLKNCIKFLKENQKRFFILACSSSIKALLKNEIFPDLCISTDGGFWAKKHLYELSKHPELNLAITAESNIDKKLFKSNVIVPLAYCDNFDDSIFNSTGIPFNKARRNGTISGTALELALSITDREIYFTGLDLEANKGFVHTEPNELEIENSLKDNKLKPTDSRLFGQSLESTQLEIYRNWFVSNSEKFNRVFRVSHDYKFKHTLGQIKDIDFKSIKIDESKDCGKQKDSLGTSFFKNSFDFFENEKSISISKKDISGIFEKLFKDEYWLKSYFPADVIAINRTCDNTKKEELKNKLNEKINELRSFIGRRIN